MQQNGLLLKGVGGSYTVKAADTLFVCKARGLFRKQGLTPLPGDYVKIETNGETNVLCEILPRKNSLTRPTAANVDRLFLVSSVCEPAPNLFLMDKLLSIACHNEIEPAVVLTKTDLGDPSALAAIYRLAGIPVFYAGMQDDIKALFALLHGSVTVFCGNTGVGKSTLLNRIDPSLALPTGEISTKLGRGRHTTRHVELFPIAGGYAADTPGFSSMELESAELIRKEDLPQTFPEFRPHLPYCRFTSCAHVTDKGCAVLEALQRGDIHPSRHTSYVQLYEAVKNLQEWQLKQKK